jgi:hypothetical protein
MGRRKKHHRYTDDQLKELATLTTQKGLRRFARVTKHSYGSVYAYWRKLTGLKLTDIDTTVKKGRPQQFEKPTYTRHEVTSVNTPKVDTVRIAIKSVQIVSTANGQELVITY